MIDYEKIKVVNKFLIRLNKYSPNILNELINLLKRFPQEMHKSDDISHYCIPESDPRDSIWHANKQCQHESDGTIHNFHYGDENHNYDMNRCKKCEGFYK